MQEEIDKIST